MRQRQRRAAPLRAGLTCWPWELRLPLPFRPSRKRVGTGGPMFTRYARPLLAAGLALAIPVSLLGQSNRDTRDPAGLRRLEAQTAGAIDVGVHRSTGAARFIRLRPGAVRGLGDGPAASLSDKQQHSRAFFREYGALLGVDDVAAMEYVGSSTDAIGETHLTWKQRYRNILVFGTLLRTHFDR